MAQAGGIPNTYMFGASGQPLGQLGPRTDTPATSLAVAQASGAPETAEGGAPVKAIVVAGALLIAARFALEFAERRMNVDAARVVTPSVYNFVSVGLMATLFIAIAAIVFNRWPVPGWTSVVNTVA